MTTPAYTYTQIYTYTYTHAHMHVTHTHKYTHTHLCAHIYTHKEAEEIILPLSEAYRFVSYD